MELDTQICERARLSRDARFDGRFFIGVRTTGIYCRPVCPVRPPKARNVRFYPSAAAAAEAGFRPCLRCRPEASPGTPAWLGTSATVSRGLRLIGEGALDRGSVDDLADRLGIGSRHLRRLFLKHLGASPLAVAQTRRLHFAKRLIDETDLSMTEVGGSAGFGSVRRFNAAIQDTYGRSPSELRAARRSRPKPSGGDGLLLRLPYRSPLEWQALLAFLAARATPGVESVEEGEYRRTIEIDGQVGRIAVSNPGDRDELLLRITLPDPRALFGIVERVRRIFDLGADPAEITAHLGRDPRLARRVAARPGLRVPGAWDGFELAVRAILGQQVSVRGATTLAGRLAERFGDAMPTGSARGTLVRLFPAPEQLVDADVASIGMPRSRADAVRALAHAVVNEEICFDAGHGLDALVASLSALPGVGEWTAHYVAMRALGEPDAFPATDLGLRRAFSDDPQRCSTAVLREAAEAWRPWRAYAAMQIWAGEATSGR